LWAALPEVFPSSKHQRRWVHETMNVLDKMPTSVQRRAKTMIHDTHQNRQYPRRAPRKRQKNDLPGLIASLTLEETKMKLALSGVNRKEPVRQMLAPAPPIGRV